MSVSTDKLSAIGMLVRTIWVFEDIYKAFMRFYEKTTGDTTCLCQNVDYKVLWAFVKTAYMRSHKSSVFVVFS